MPYLKHSAQPIHPGRGRERTVVQQDHVVERSERKATFGSREIDGIVRGQGPDRFSLKFDWLVSTRNPGCPQRVGIEVTSHEQQHIWRLAHHQHLIDLRKIEAVSLLPSRIEPEFPETGRQV